MWESEGADPLVVVDPLVVLEDPLLVMVVPPLDVPEEVLLVVLDVLSGTCAHAEFDGADVPALL
jgi:hypothetical protein